VLISEKLHGTELLFTEAVNTSLPLSIRNMMLEEITTKIALETPIVDKVSSTIKERIEVFPLEKGETFSSVIGVDAGSQIIPLASRQYAVISALAFSLPFGEKYFQSPESVSQPGGFSKNGFLEKVNTLREAKLFETAYQIIRNKCGIELILIDGPLAFSNNWQGMKDNKSRQRLITAIKGFLNLCMENDIIVASIVKRPSARYLINYLGMQKETDLSDSFLMLQILQYGERTDIFNPRTATMNVSKSSLMMDVIGTPVLSTYARLSREWYIPPVRIDIPHFALSSIDDVVNYCFSTSHWKGIPLAILKADEEVKVSKKFIGGVYREIVSKVGRCNLSVSHLAPYWGEERWMGA
jgi:hypothetical protein